MPRTYGRGRSSPRTEKNTCRCSHHPGPGRCLHFCKVGRSTRSCLGERGGAQEVIPKPVPERRPLIQCSRKRGRHPLNEGHGRVPDDRVPWVEALTQGPVYAMSPLSAAMQVHQDTQSHQGWEPVWSRLSLEAPLVLLLEALCPPRDAEQGSDTTCPHTMVLPSILQAPKQPTVPGRAWCPTEPQLHTLPVVTRGVPKLLEDKQLPLPPHHCTHCSGSAPHRTPQGTCRCSR